MSNNPPMPALTGPEIAVYLERMIAGLLDQTDLPRTTIEVGIRLIVGAGICAALTEDRAVALHDLDQACAAIGALGAITR